MLEKPPECKGCPFESIGIGFVPPDGESNSTYKLIAEAPGEDEANHGYPLIGKTGRLLRQAILMAGFPAQTCEVCLGEANAKALCHRCAGLGEVPRDIILFNTIQCRPPDNDYSKVPAEAVAFCKKAHWPTLSQGDTAFLVGGRALDAAYRSCQPLSVERFRGSILKLGINIIGIPMLHPSFISRGNWRLLPLLQMDLAAGRTFEAFTVPKIVDEIKPGPYLAIDVEGGSKDAKGEVDLVGLTTDGIHVEQVHNDPKGLARVEYLCDEARIIFAHFAKYDVWDQLRLIGVRIALDKVVDTCVTQAAYQSNMERGLDNAISITLPARWTYHKSMHGDYGNRDKDRAATLEAWEQWIPGISLATDHTKYLIYNMLDTASDWRLGMELKRRLDR